MPKTNRATVPMMAMLISLIATTTAAAQREKVLYSFIDNGVEAYGPNSNLIFDTAGNLYGQAWGGAFNDGSAFELSPSPDGTWSEKVLFSFDGTDGGFPRNGTGLIFDGAGNLYGTTSTNGAFSGGTVFELTPQADGSWVETTLHDFGQGADGAGANGGLVADPDGNLYGTTIFGGAYGVGNPYGGTVFQVSPGTGAEWSEEILHNFGGLPTSWGGNNPYAGLTIDGAGNLYGVASFGGPAVDYDYEGGTIVELSRDADGAWTEKRLLHAFDVKDGSVPYAALTLDAAGNLYGTTEQGGIAPCVGLGDDGCGVAFELSPEGDGTWTYKVLHNFGSYAEDGIWPAAKLVFDSAGNLYGTTYYGGKGTCEFGCGVVFELIPGANGNWSEKIVHTFNPNVGDGAAPYAGLILDASGNLYGTTVYGGATGRGAVFEITP